MRRCVPRGVGAGLARDPFDSGLGFSLKFCLRSYIGGNKA